MGGGVAVGFPEGLGVLGVGGDVDAGGVGDADSVDEGEGELVASVGLGVLIGVAVGGWEGEGELVGAIVGDALGRFMAT